VGRGEQAQARGEDGPLPGPSGGRARNGCPEENLEARICGHDASHTSSLAAMSDTELSEVAHAYRARTLRAPASHDASGLWQRYAAVLEVCAQRREQPVVVIPCSSRKLAHRAPARELYVGSYHRAARRAAEALTRSERVLILSGRYGLLSLDQTVEPYEQRIDAPGAVRVEVLHGQLQRRDLLRRRTVVLAGGAYAAPLLEAFGPSATELLVLPLRGSRGIGDHLALFARISASGRLPGLD
jgi:hypothetical protein